MRLPQLPRSTGPLVGRTREVAQVRSLLLDPEVRLLTLTGPPGVGKTRLAVECSRRCADAFPDGVVFVDLTSVPEPALVMPSVARVLGIRIPAGRPAVERLGTVLRRSRMLLVLDNFEHLLEAGPGVARLLETTEDLRVLATSREPLRLRGEHRFGLAPLAVPDLRRLSDPDRLPAVPSVALLLNRVKAVDRAFRLDARNARTVAELCVRLDGLPLALELVAPSFALLPPQAILERLDHRLALLSRAARDLPPRHHTLRAAVGWSYALLPSRLQLIFRRLGAFRGGWTLEAAAAVCDVPEHEMLDALAALVDKSLVERDPTAQTVRFRMLESVREFALEQLGLSGEVEPVEVRHARFFLALGRRCDAQMAGPVQAESLDLLEAEHDNLRAAMQRLAERGQGAEALGLAGVLGEFWALRGYWAEGRRWLERVLELRRGEDPGPRARCLRALALLAWIADDFGEAEARGREALEAFTATGDRLGMASTLRILAHVARARGRYRLAASLLRQGLRRYREAGHAWGVAISCSSLALVALADGRPAAATSLLEESLSRYRECGDPWGVAVCLQQMGQAARSQGRHEEAWSLLEQALAGFRRLQDKIGMASTLADLGAAAQAANRGRTARQMYRDSLALWWALGSQRGVAECLEGLALRCPDPREASRWLGAAAGLRRRSGAAPPVPHRAVIQAACHRARSALGPAVFQAEYARGSALPLADVVRAALGEPPAQTAALSRREHEVAAWIARGLTNRDIAAELGVSERTVDSHVLHILNKLGFRSRAQIAAWAAQQGVSPATDAAHDPAVP